MDDPTNVASSVASLRRHLASAQWWPADILRRHQLGLLEPLIAHARLTVPWYRQWFSEASQDPDRTSVESLWRALPVLTRFDIQAAGESLHSESLPAQHGRISRQWTSGSTASPVSVLTTALTGRVWIASTIREYDWQAYDLAGTLASIRCAAVGEARPPEGARRRDWGLAVAGQIATGAGVMLDVRSTTGEQAEWLQREQPDMLQTYPSIVLELARHFVQTDQRLPSLKRVYTFGEILEPKVRELCRQAWGVEVLDSYSTTEVGYVASQCVQGGNYHVHAEHLLVEILDDRGRECAAGETGRVVITDLFNYAMPLLRYEIGDYAEVGEPCSCGRKLPTLRRILGRQRNMILMPNGEKRWPVWEIDALDTFEGRLPVRQYQAIQLSRNELEVRLVVGRPLLAQEEAGIRSLLAELLGEGFHFRLSYVDSIGRGPTGKFEDFRCDVS